MTDLDITMIYGIIMFTLGFLSACVYFTLYM